MALRAFPTHHLLISTFGTVPSANCTFAVQRLQSSHFLHTRTHKTFFLIFQKFDSNPNSIQIHIHGNISNHHLLIFTEPGWSAVQIWLFFWPKRFALYPHSSLRTLTEPERLCAVEKPPHLWPSHCSEREER